MKRDMDYIRELLFEIEAAPADELWSREEVNPTPEMPRLSQHLKLLVDATFIEGRHEVYLGGGELWYDVRLTWKGNEFLDTIRSDAVWKKTKERLAKAGGTASVQVISEVAGAIVRNLLHLP